MYKVIQVSEHVIITYASVERVLFQEVNSTGQICAYIHPQSQLWRRPCAAQACLKGVLIHTHAGAEDVYVNLYYYLLEIPTL